MPPSKGTKPRTTRAARRRPDDMPLSAGFPERLEQARTTAGMSMEGLAQEIGYSGRSSIQNLEAGNRTPDLPLAERIAQVLGVRPGWLAYGDGEP